MASTSDFVEKVLERFEPLDITAKPMFGEYGLYYRGKMFGVICDNTLFIKVTQEGGEIAGRISTDSPYPGAKPAFKISSAKLAQREWLTSLIEVTTQSLPLPKPKKKK